MNDFKKAYIIDLLTNTVQQGTRIPQVLLSICEFRQSNPNYSIASSRLEVENCDHNIFHTAMCHIAGALPSSASATLGWYVKTRWSRNGQHAATLKFFLPSGRHLYKIPRAHWGQQGEELDIVPAWHILSMLSGPVPIRNFRPFRPVQPVGEDLQLFIQTGKPDNISKACQKWRFP